MELAVPLLNLHLLGTDLAWSSKVSGAMPQWRGKELGDLFLRSSSTNVNTFTEFEGRTLSEMQHNILEAKRGVLGQEPNFKLAASNSAIQTKGRQKEALA